jgi:hypothetical protein
MGKANKRAKVVEIGGIKVRYDDDHGVWVAAGTQPGAESGRDDGSIPSPLPAHAVWIVRSYHWDEGTVEGVFLTEAGAREAVDQLHPGPWTDDDAKVTDWRTYVVERHEVNSSRRLPTDEPGARSAPQPARGGALPPEPIVKPWCAKPGHVYKPGCVEERPHNHWPHARSDGSLYVVEGEPMLEGVDESLTIDAGDMTMASLGLADPAHVARKLALVGDRSVSDVPDQRVMTIGSQYAKVVAVVVVTAALAWWAL